MNSELTTLVIAAASFLGAGAFLLACNCSLSCPFHNYGMGLNPTFENPNGDYTGST